MKKIITFLGLSLIITATSCKNQTNAVARIKTENLEKAKVRDAKIAAGAPIIEFDKTVYNFGKVTEGDVVETSFTLKNIGKTDLVVTNAQTTCGCTVPIWPKEAVKPGESAEMKVKFNTLGKPNQQSKQVTLYTNTAKGIEVVTLKGFVNKKTK